MYQLYTEREGGRGIRYELASLASKRRYRRKRHGTKYNGMLIALDSLGKTNKQKNSLRRNKFNSVLGKKRANIEAQKE